MWTFSSTQNLSFKNMDDAYLYVSMGFSFYLFPSYSSFICLFSCVFNSITEYACGSFHLCFGLFASSSTQPCFSPNLILIFSHFVFQCFSVYCFELDLWFVPIF